MRADEVLVVVAGVLAIAAVNWWFFLAGREPPARRDARHD